MALFQHLKSILRDTRGATAVEYGLIAALIVIAMVGAMQSFADETIGMWTHVQTTVEEAR